MTGRDRDKRMVRVYIGQFPDTADETRQQSKWVRRLLELALEREYPKLRGPFLLDRDNKGKPFLSEYPDIQINLSHSGCYAACAIGEKPVGIDVECWKSRKAQERIVKKFHLLEQKAYEAAEEGERNRRFHELWVAKESFLKAEGTGLGIPLDSFYIEGIDEGAGRVVQSRNNRSYYYRLCRMAGRKASLAVCSEEASFAEEPVWVELAGPGSNSCQSVR